ncbi:hypothetical protein [Natroniella sp. ANB-PHB2]|uniref:hypothetical protein n=1 Tax=Natroniella sp. ANB-PHB2 TaxID=3384444 RepID=UPI0038D3CD5B
MSWLAKKLALLFLVIASIVVLAVALIANLNWLTIVKRSVIGGLVFSLIGAIIGQLIANNLNSNKSEKLAGAEAEIAVNEEKNEGEAEESELTPLNFNDLSQDNPNIINDIEENSKKTAQIVRNMKEEK